MNDTEQKFQRHGKKIIKKYILHQKVNPRLLGVEIYNKHIKTPHEAYLSCKLIFKRDIQSLMELEQMAKKIRESWLEEDHELSIKKINIYTSPAYIVLTFTLGFFEPEQVKQLPVFRNYAQELIESYAAILKQEQEAEYKRKEEKMYNALEKFSQLTEKMDVLENRLKKNEAIVLDSGELLKNELTKVSQTLKEQIKMEEYQLVDASNEQEKMEIQNDSQQVEEIRHEHSKEKPKHKRNFILMRTSQYVKTTARIQPKQKEAITEKPEPINSRRKPIPKIELEIIRCFSTSENLNKKKMISKRQFLELKAKVEFIDYLWMLLELEGKEEIIIANELSCRKLIEDLGQFMERVEKITANASIFNYWVYCSQEMLIKLEGYAALKELLSNSLRQIEDITIMNSDKK
jgi:hypothetical protein